MKNFFITLSIALVLLAGNITNTSLFAQELSIVTPDPNDKNRKEFRIDFSTAALGYVGDFFITTPFQAAAGYKVFVTYGDGIFDMFMVSDADVTPQTPIFKFEHNYCCRNVNGFPVEVQITKIYTRDDEVLRIANDVVHGTDDMVPPADPAPFPAIADGNLLRFDINRNPVPGFEFTAILTYFDTCTITPTSITMTYDQSVLTLVDTLYYYDETIQELAPGEIKLDYNTTVPISALPHPRNVFFTFAVSEGAKAGIDLPFTFNFLNDCVEQDVSEEAVRTLDSFDPNYKIANVDTISSNQCQVIEYIIHFQNIGEDSTEEITIIDQFDELLNTNDACSGTALTTGVYMAGDSIPNVNELPAGYMGSTYSEMMQCDNGTMEWVLDPGRLRGTEEEGYGREFRELDTWGEIVFEISTTCDFEYGAVLENEATIIFDNNLEIVTDTSRIVKFCCQEHTPNFSSAIIDTEPYFDLPDLFDPASVVVLDATYGLAGDSAGISVNPSTGEIIYEDNSVSNHIDVLTVVGCDTTGVCDTVEIPLCVGVNLYPCDTLPCDPTACSLSVGVEDVLTESDIPQILVYPNPMGDRLHLDYGKYVEDVYRLALYDLQGRLLKEIDVNRSGESVIEVGHLVKGMYVLRINDRWGKKLIK